MYRSGYVQRILAGVLLYLRIRPTSMLSGSSLKQRTIRGSVLTIVGFGSGQILRICSNLALTRLLFPEAFGLMAIVTVCFIGLEMLSDIGINTSVIQSKRGDDPDFLRTAWTLGVIRGVVLWLCACLIAWPAAWFYGEPQLAYMIPVSGFTSLLLGFQSTAIPQHSRQMKFGRLTVLRLISQAFGLTVTVLLAWRMRSVWALVLGGIIGTAFQTWLPYRVLPGIRHYIAIDRNYVREIIRFGRWLLFATAMGYLAGQAADKLVLGKLVSPEILGIYSMAFMVAQLPSSVVAALMGQVFYSALSEVARNDDSRYAEKLLHVRDSIWRPLLLLIVSLGFFGPVLFETLWDPRYHAAGWMLQLLLINVWCDGLNSSLNAALLARGNSFASTVQNALMLLIGVPGMMLGYFHGDVAGLIAGMLAGKVAAHIALHLLLWRQHISVWRQDCVAHLMFAVFAGLVVLSSGLSISLPNLAAFSLGAVTHGDLFPIAIALCSTTFALGLTLWPYRHFRRRSQGRTQLA